jgi:hypothetical protein
MKRGQLVLLLVATLAGFLLRLALVPRTDGIDWDGPGYMQEAERLRDLLAGTFPSILGAKTPIVYPLGLPLLLAALAPIAGSTRDAGVLLSLVAGTALIPLGFFLARKLAGETAGLVAAAWASLDPGLIERSATLQSESVFAALLAVAFLLHMDASSPRRKVGAILAFVAAASIRSIGVPIGLVAALDLWVARERRRALVLVAALALLSLGHKALETRNGASPYWMTLHRLALWEEGEYPTYFEVDASGATLFQGTDETGYVAAVRAHPGTAARILGASALAAGRALLPFALALPFVAARRWLLVLGGAILAAALVPLLLLQRHEYMERMLLPTRPELFALAAAGLVAALERLRISRGSLRALLVVLGPGAMLALLVTQPPELARSPSTVRAAWDRAAERIARVVPPSERILRGPGGDRTLIALAGRCDVYAPGTTPAKVVAFTRANGIHYIVHAPGVVLEPYFAPARLETEALGNGQLLSRIAF